MIDHLGVVITNHVASTAFYDAALAPLSITRVAEVPLEYTGGVHHIGYGTDRPRFWISDKAQPIGPCHICFVANSREEVDAFYAAAMKAGGTCNGDPGIRAHYHEHYYAAFVLDPDGHNIEAVCHTPPA